MNIKSWINKVLYKFGYIKASIVPVQVREIRVGFEKLISEAVFDPHQFIRGYDPSNPSTSDTINIHHIRQQVMENIKRELYRELDKYIICTEYKRDNAPDDVFLRSPYSSIIRLEIKVAKQID